MVGLSTSTLSSTQRGAIKISRNIRSTCAFSPVERRPNSGLKSWIKFTVETTVDHLHPVRDFTFNVDHA